MSDIVERLRKNAQYLDPLAYGLATSAADEIERLRAPANTRGEREKVIEECARVADLHALAADCLAAQQSTSPDFNEAELEGESRAVSAQCRAVAQGIRALAEDGPPTKEGFGTGSQPAAAPHPSPASSEDTTK